jgi:hypothetical protein
VPRDGVVKRCGTMTNERLPSRDERVTARPSREAHLTRLHGADDRFAAWLAALEARHLADRTFAEVSRSLRALSSTYVERRHTIAGGSALSGAGKRAAFALFYAPLHYLTVRAIVEALPGAVRDVSLIADLGCGTGAAGAAWAVASSPDAARPRHRPRPHDNNAAPKVIGIDRHPWALGEAAWTYRELGIDGRTVRDDVTRARLPKGRAAILAAFTLNELSETARDEMLPRLLERIARGDRVLIVEPLAGFVAPWWKRWRDAFEQAGGRADEWRFRIELPPIVAKLDRAAGLHHRELTARSLWAPNRAG